MFAFGIGSAVGGAAGCFYARFVGTLVPDAFFITESFTILSMVIVGGMGTLIGPVFGAILLTLLPELLRGIGDLRLVVYGVALTLVVLFMPGGLVQAWNWSAPGSPARARVVAMTTLLSAKGLHKSFGGVQRCATSRSTFRPARLRHHRPERRRQIDAAQLDQRRLSADAGTMSFDGADLVGLPAHRRVRLGLARTFQKIRLFKHLSVLDNVVAGFHIHHDIPAWQYFIHGTAFRRDHARCRDEAFALLSFVGLAATARHARRLAPLWRAAHAGIGARAGDLAAPACSSTSPPPGLNAAEVDRLLDRIRILRKRGLTVVVVEHNMELVMNVADRVLVMDYGQYLFEGAPAEVQKNARP